MSDVGLHIGTGSHVVNTNNNGGFAVSQEGTHKGGKVKVHAETLTSTKAAKQDLSKTTQEIAKRALGTTLLGTITSGPNRPQLLQARRQQRIDRKATSGSTNSIGKKDRKDRAGGGGALSSEIDDEEDENDLKAYGIEPIDESYEPEKENDQENQTDEEKQEKRDKLGAAITDTLSSSLIDASINLTETTQDEIDNIKSILGQSYPKDVVDQYIMLNRVREDWLTDLQEARKEVAFLTSRKESIESDLAEWPKDGSSDKAIALLKDQIANAQQKVSHFDALLLKTNGVRQQILSTNPTRIREAIGFLPQSARVLKNQRLQEASSNESQGSEGIKKPLELFQLLFDKIGNLEKRKEVVTAIQEAFFKETEKTVECATGILDKNLQFLGKSLAGAHDSTEFVTIRASEKFLQVVSSTLRFSKEETDRLQQISNNKLTKEESDISSQKAFNLTFSFIDLTLSEWTDRQQVNELSVEMTGSDLHRKIFFLNRLQNMIIKSDICLFHNMTSRENLAMTTQSIMDELTEQENS